MILLILLIEFTYIIARQIILHYSPNLIFSEIAISFARLLSVIYYWIAFKDYLRNRVGKVPPLNLLLTLSLLLVMIAPVLIGNYCLNSIETKSVFCLTSIIVGIREEITYRGLLQNLLRDKLGLINSLILSNIVFLLSHIGYQSFVPSMYLGNFIFGLFWGILYWKTGSLVLCILTHSVLDMIWSFTPILGRPLNPWYEPLIVIIGILFLLMVKPIEQDYGTEKGYGSINK